MGPSQASLSGTMVKFLKPGKAVIVKNHDEGTSGRRYGHALVCGLSKEPRKVIKKQSLKKQARKTSIKTFIKTINYSHMMPTRYNLADVDLKSSVTPEVNENSEAKKAANKEAKKVLEEKFKTGKNRW